MIWLVAAVAVVIFFIIKIKNGVNEIKEKEAERQQKEAEQNEISALQKKVDEKRFYAAHGCSEEEYVAKLCSKDNIKGLVRKLEQIAKKHEPTYITIAFWPYSSDPFSLDAPTPHILFEYSQKQELTMELNDIIPVVRLKVKDYISFGTPSEEYIEKFSKAIFNSSPILQSCYSYNKRWIRKGYDEYCVDSFILNSNL